MKALITLSSQPLGGMETFSSHLSEAFPDLKIIDFSQASGLISRLPFPPATMPQKGLAISRHFLRIKGEIRADMVFTSGLYGWYLSWKGLDIPIVNILHGVAREFADKSYRKGTFDYYRMKYVYSLAEKISASGSISVCNSGFTKDLIKKHYKVNSRVIYNAVDTRKIFPIGREEARKSLGLPDKTTAIFVGPPSYSKGFDIVQRLSSIHREINFLCISYQNQVPNQKNLRIVTNVDHSQLYKYYSASDFCIFPSRFEGFGYVPMEALACNIPVIANRTGILSEISPPGSYMARPDAPSFSDAISGLVSNFKYPRSRSFIKEHFSLKRFSREYRSLEKNQTA